MYNNDSKSRKSAKNINEEMKGLNFVYRYELRFVTVSTCAVLNYRYIG